MGAATFRRARVRGSEPSAAELATEVPAAEAESSPVPKDGGEQGKPKRTRKPKEKGEGPEVEEVEEAEKAEGAE